jgi:hypothetical protein
MGFDATWRWRKEHGDRYFRDYWGKIVQFLGLPHMLGGQAQSRILLDRIEASIGDRVQLTAQVRNPDYTPFGEAKVDVSMTQADGTTVRIELPAVASRPGFYRTTLYPDRTGRILFSLDERFMAEEQELNVSSTTREFRDAGMNLDLMRELAAETGGLVLHPACLGETNRAGRAGEAAGDEETKNLVATARRIEDEGKQPLEDDEFVNALAAHALELISGRRPLTRLEVEQPLWDTLTALLLAIVLLCTEYFFRKRWYLD